MEASAAANIPDAYNYNSSSSSRTLSSSSSSSINNHNHPRSRLLSVGGMGMQQHQHISASNILLRSPLSSLLEYTGILRTPSTNHHHSSESSPSSSDDDDSVSSRHLFTTNNAYPHINDSESTPLVAHPHPAPPTNDGDTGEVSIRIIGANDDHHHHHNNNRISPSSSSLLLHNNNNNVLPPPPPAVSHSRPISRSSSAVSVLSSLESQSLDFRTHSHSINNAPDTADPPNNTDSLSSSSSSYQRYDIQQAARWIEQVLPFSLLLLIVFIRQHLQGFCVTIWIAAFMFKSNDIVRKQTALKGERRLLVLMGIAVLFTLHILAIYWWYQNDDLLYPLLMLPPTTIPPFWHGIFIIMVNDTLVRQAAMVVKCGLLMYYKNSRGRNYRRQGQMLTLVEYLILLYRALLPAPVWYRFFLNKEYGSLFSSLMTGLYLTFKLTSVVEKVQSFITALRALSRKDIHYGSYATSEQVIAAGDLCAICQEKMHAPILLRCKHVFCEDCVSEWFERERTCPLCRALVKPEDLRSFGDGSTSLFFQLF